MFSKSRLAALACILPALVAFGGPAAGQDRWASPEAATGWRSNVQASTAKSYMVAAANPLAVEAGLAILRDGGSAADAAISVQLVLNLVEPQSSGLGGGAFALHWDASGKRLRTYDGRESAPAAAKPDRFLVDGRPRAFDEAVFGGLSIGVPGALRLLETLHKQHGRLSWPRLFEPAIKIASDGFHVSPRLHLLLRWQGAQSFAPAARRYFFGTTGSPWPTGYLLRNPEFAATLRAIAERGADAFYTGDVAAAIVDAARQAPNHQSDITAADLAGYRVKEREPVCTPYRRLRVCGMGPPASGGVAVSQILTLLEPFDLGKSPVDAMNARALHLIAEAEKLAYADRNQYVGDPDFAPAPKGLLDSNYLASRRGLINPDAVMRSAQPGTPPQAAAAPFGDDETLEVPGTTHFSIVDRDGNAVSMTTTIESAFGSRVWAAGFLLNNELTDFSFRPIDRDGRPLANAIASGKRPRSSMAPTIVFDAEGKPWAVLGSPGGSRIILYVVKALVGLIDWKLDAQAALGLMNFGSRGGAFEIEVDHPAAVWHALKVKPYGHRVNADLLTSGTHAIIFRPDGTLEGGADPRREGVAKGE
jgi:gamma-glutamyltranspeptidase / glutathione hydrolase